MKILQPNLLPFSYPSNVGTENYGMICLFYPYKVSLYSNIRTCMNQATCAAYVEYKADEGFALVPQKSYGMMPVSGSRWDEILQATVHYPSQYTPKGNTTGGSSSPYIDDAYNRSEREGNIALSRRFLNPYDFPGCVQDPNYVPKFRGTYSSVWFSEEVSVNCVVSKHLGTKDGISGQVRVSTSTTSYGYSLPANVDKGNLQAMTGTQFFLSRLTGSIRQPVLANTDRVENIKNTEIVYAICIMTKAPSAVQNVATECFTFGATVGERGSGAMLELDSLSLSTGEYPTVIGMRTHL